MFLCRRLVQRPSCSTTWRPFGVLAQASLATLGPVQWIFLWVDGKCRKKPQKCQHWWCLGLISNSVFLMKRLSPASVPCKVNRENILKNAFAWHTLRHPSNMSWRIYPVASCFWLWGGTLEKTHAGTHCALCAANFRTTPFSPFRSPSSFVPSSTRSSLTSSLTRWWSRWFQRLSVVRPQYTVQRRPSLVSWCSKRSTTRSPCARGWWSRWFHWNLQLLSPSSDQEFVPEPCHLRLMWSHSLFSHCCFGQCEHPHPLISLIKLWERSVPKWAHRLWMRFCDPVSNGHWPLERWAMLSSLPIRLILAVGVLETRFMCCWQRFLRKI